MFGLFKSTPVTDPQLGTLNYKGGHWRGTITLGDGAAVPLAIVGDRKAPNPEALQMARRIAGNYVGWRATIENALFEHYQPYGEALAEAGFAASSAPPPPIAAASGVWPHVTLVFAAVVTLDGVPTIELGYTTAWDEEHTLGARFRGNEFIELCGSVLPA